MADIQRSVSAKRRPFYEIPVVLLLSAIAIGGCVSFYGPHTRQAPFLRYRLTLKNPSLQVVHVAGTMYGATAREVTLTTLSSVSNAGVEPIGFAATSTAGDCLDVGSGAGAWTVRNGGRDFVYEYDLVLTLEDRYSPNVRMALTALSEDRSRLLGGDIFLIPEVPIADGILVDVDLFEGPGLVSSWRSNARRIIVPRPDDLTLTTVAAGSYRVVESIWSNTEIVLAIAGHWSFSDEELFDVIRRIVVREISLFGSSPYNRYLFICDHNPMRGSEKFAHYGVHFGGSIMLLLDPGIDRSQLYDVPMSIVAHEFFHNFNGESLRPRSDDFLWFTEGATVYYSYEVLLALDIVTPQQYRTKRMDIVRRYVENPYRQRVPIGSAVNSDLGDKDMVNLLYDGGFLAAEALDSRLASLTGGTATLIDVLVYLYGDGTHCRIIDEEILIRSILEVSGHDLSRFLDVLIHSPASPMLHDLL